jgi:hypothetical protein
MTAWNLESQGRTPEYLTYRQIAPGPLVGFLFFRGTIFPLKRSDLWRHWIFPKCCYGMNFCLLCSGVCSINLPLLQEIGAEKLCTGHLTAIILIVNLFKKKDCFRLIEITEPPLTQFLILFAPVRRIPWILLS